MRGARTRDCTKDEGGGYRLTTTERKRILTNNIYSVDIDSQAVEVTKLSLLLKVLEGESDQSLQTQLFHERVLPDLGRNIKCGNSLIGPDFYGTAQLDFLDDNDRARINVFDWGKEFPEIMQAGGFDAVIGNPPYVRIQTMQEWMPESAEYFKQRYKSTQSGNYDIYVVFIEFGLSLLAGDGLLSFIMPQKFWQVQYGEPLRGLLAEGENTNRIVSFTHNQVFDTAFVNTCILVLSKRPSKTFSYVEVPRVGKNESLSKLLSNATESTLSSRILTSEPWVLRSAEKVALLEKLKKAGPTLEECTSRIFQGLKTSADKIYVLELRKEAADSYRAYSPQLGKEIELERGLCHKLIKGTEMRPYAPLPAERIIVFPYIKNGGAMRLIDEAQLKRQFPKTYGYAKENETYLRARENGKMDNAGWYGYGRTQALDVMGLPKIITPDLAPKSSFLLDETGDYFFLGGAAGGYGILPKPGLNSLYLLGILNSSSINFFITMSGQQMESGYYSFEARFIRSAPIPTLNIDEPHERARHDKMVSLAECMLALRKQLAAKTPHEQENLKRQIDATDRQIDKLVYELYGLTDEEIRVVESAA